MLPTSPHRRNEHYWHFFLNVPQYEEKIKDRKVKKKSSQYSLISWKKEWGSEGILLPCTCITQFTAVIKPISELGNSKMSSWLWETALTSLHIVCVVPKFQHHPALVSNSSYWQLPIKTSIHPIYVWSATFQSLPVLNSHRIPYILTYSSFLHLKTQSNSFSTSSELARSKLPMELSTAQCLSLQYGGCRTLEKQKCKNASYI